MKKEFKNETVNVTINMETTTIEDKINKKTIVCKSKSEMFKQLYDLGMEVCEISKTCESHYSFVYGVISANREIRQVPKASKSDEIRKLADEGKTPGEIAKLLNSNYSFIFSVVKKHKASQTPTEEVKDEKLA